MRFLLLAALCMFGSPVKAEIFHVQDGLYEVYGNFGGGIINTGSVSYMTTGFATINPGTYDPDNGPFFGYQITVRANDGIVQACSFSQTMSMCERALHNQPFFNLLDIDGDGIASLFISSSVLTTNMTMPPLISLFASPMASLLPPSPRRRHGS